jgi:hypothetical protein
VGRRYQSQLATGLFARNVLVRRHPGHADGRPIRPVPWLRIITVRTCVAHSPSSGIFQVDPVGMKHEQAGKKM